MKPSNDGILHIFHHSNLAQPSVKTLEDFDEGSNQGTEFSFTKNVGVQWIREVTWTLLKHSIDFEDLEESEY